jgi:hypothetical protein
MAFYYGEAKWFGRGCIRLLILSKMANDELSKGISPNPFQKGKSRTEPGQCFFQSFFEAP